MKFAVAVFLVSFVAVAAEAQTTGSIIGTASSGGIVLPGVTVSITSAALQGTRSTVTGPNGDYRFASLLPGTYHVTFELEGLTTVTRNVEVRLSVTARLDAVLEAARVQESITVTASAPSAIATPQITMSIPRETVEALPVERSIVSRLQLSPGVNNAGVNKQPIINGAFSFDNLYLVNGVVVNDTLRGQPEDLFIEDAIQETAILSGAVSAEYGRFSGGVVNTITKSGGNNYAGSVRDNLTNPAWTARTAFRDPVSGAAQPANRSRLNQQLEATLGGYIVKDRLWFFSAFRKFNEAIDSTTTQTNVPYVNVRDNRRRELKLSAHLGERQDVVASYLDNDTNETNSVFGTAVDLRVLSDRRMPNRIGDLHYTAVAAGNLLFEATASRRDFSIVGWGGPRDLIDGTMLVDNSSSAAQAVGAGRRMWSPTYCGACDPRVRSNRDYSAKASYFLSTPRFGSHTLVAGYDEFHDLRTENNYKSGSDYRLLGDFVYDGPNVWFHIAPGTGYVEWDPIFELSKGGDVATKSLFINDRWDSGRWSLNAGLRDDRNQGRNQSHDRVSDAAALSPRISAMFDVRGDGVHRFSAGYGVYTSKFDVTIADWTARGGQPALIVFNYRGPEYNAFDPVTGKITGTPMPTDQVIRDVFQWFMNAADKSIDSITVPGLSERLAPNLRSPRMDEWTAGYGFQFGTRGSLRADLIRRRWSDFYVIQRDTTTGHATTPAGTAVDVGVIANSDHGLRRTYEALQLRGSWRVLATDIGASYTLSALRGNVEGETYNRATMPDSSSEYPEYKSFRQNDPAGYLSGDIRHVATVWIRRDFKMRLGTLNAGVLERYHSGAAFSAAGTLDPRSAVANPAGYYATPPSSVTYFFSGRGAYRLDAITSTDLTATFSRGKVFLRADIVNVFDRQGVEFAATAIGPVVETRVYTRKQSARSSDGLVALQPFNPNVTTPVQYIPGVSDPKAGPYNFQLAPNFGKPVNQDAFQQPRTFRVAAGVRF